MSSAEDEILNPNIPDLPSKAEVYKLCRKSDRYINHLIYTGKGRKISIKFGNATMAEARTQQFFYEQISRHPHSSIRIPEVYHAFTMNYGAY
jgi:hypothetical protein